MKFYLFAHGPFNNILRRLGLANEINERYKSRILFFCLLAWLPLFILTFLSRVDINLFLSDISVHVRLLISLSLLLSAEVIADEPFQIVVNQFLKCHIISDKDQPAFNASIASAINFSNSTIAEILIFLFVITVGGFISRKIIPFDISAWYIVQQNEVSSLSLSGYWYFFISLPIFQFFLLRWYYRVFIWYRFLWQVSRLRLQLNVLHPDFAGGIGFLNNSIYAFEPFLMAHSFLLSGMIFSFILNSHATLWQFKNEIITWMSILLVIPLLPLCFFILPLIREKRNGTNEYSVFANQYVTDFRKKWFHTPLTHNEQWLGTADLQALSDLDNSFNVSAQMRVLPFSKNIILLVLIVTALPFIPLIFTVMPLEKIIAQITSIIF